MPKIFSYFKCNLGNSSYFYFCCSYRHTKWKYTTQEGGLNVNSTTSCNLFEIYYCPVKFWTVGTTEISKSVMWFFWKEDTVVSLMWHETKTYTCVSLVEVILSGIDNRYKLSGLSSSTDYEVMLTAVFRDESESDTVSVIETTCKWHWLATCTAFVLLTQAVVVFALTNLN